MVIVVLACESHARPLKVLTEVGFYQSPTNKSYVDATNLKSMADIVEMRCSASGSWPEQVECDV